MIERAWAKTIIDKGYRALLVYYHPDGKEQSEKARLTDICQRLAVARDELNSLIEGTKYQTQVNSAPTNAPVYSPATVGFPSINDETINRIVDLAEEFVFGMKGRPRPARRPRRPGR